MIWGSLLDNFPKRRKYKTHSFFVQSGLWVRGFNGPVLASQSSNNQCRNWSLFRHRSFQVFGILWLLFVLCLGEKGNDFKFEEVSLTPSSTFQVLLESTHSGSRHVDVPFSSRSVLCAIWPPRLLTGIFCGPPTDLGFYCLILFSCFAEFLELGWTPVSWSGTRHIEQNKWT